MDNINGKALIEQLIKLTKDNKIKWGYLDQNSAVYYNFTTLQLFHKKNVIQDFLMYNKFANKKIRKKVILYDRLIIQRKNYNW